MPEILGLRLNQMPVRGEALTCMRDTG